MNKKTLNMFKFLTLVGLLITVLLYIFSPAEAILGVLFTLIITPAFCIRFINLFGFIFTYADKSIQIFTTYTFFH